MSGSRVRSRITTVLSAFVLAAVGTVAPTAAAAPALTRDFAELQGSIDAVIGIAAAAAGTDSQPVLLGTWHSGPAWSTMKVPLVLAALRDDPLRGITEEMVAAITRSDNAAAEAVWAGLGPPTDAAARVESVLRDHGDPTVVTSVRTRPEFSSFGQSDWSLGDQSRFLAAAACDPRDAPVLELMGQIAPDQRWGAGQIPNAVFKGGWGPSPTGAYLVRQMALIPTPTGTAAVAIAAAPASGTYEDGVAAVSRITAWLAEHTGEFPAGHCRSK